MTKDNLIHSIELSLGADTDFALSGEHTDNPNYLIAVNYVDGTEAYCEFNPIDKVINDYELMRDTEVISTELSDTDRDIYNHFINTFSNIMINNIAYNINRAKFTLYRKGLLMETWWGDIYLENNRRANCILFQRVIHEKGIGIDEYEKINEDNSVTTTDILGMSVVYNKIVKDIDNNEN